MKHWIRNIFLAVTILFASQVNGQTTNFIIYGFVIDTISNTPVQNHAVNIKLDSASIATPQIDSVVHTDTSGFYYFNALLDSNTTYHIQIQTSNCYYVYIQKVDTILIGNTPSYTHTFFYCDTSLCSAQFLKTNDTILPFTVHFTNYSLGNNITSYYWDFGDYTYSYSQNPSHTYNDTGFYQVCLLISGPGCSSNRCKVIQIDTNALSGTCSAKFTYQISGSNPATVNFTNTTTSSANPITDTISYLWHMSDGTYSTNEHFVHTFSQSGWHTACLYMLLANKITGDTLCWDSTCTAININNIPSCSAIFTITPDSTNPYLYYFSNSSTGSPFSFFWDFGDGMSGSGKTPSHLYNSAGIYQVCLTISDSATGCYDSFCDTLIISQSILCSADFGYQLDSFNIAPRLYTFADLSVGSVGLNNWIWDFGDGTSSTLVNPIHQYTASGTYNVNLRVMIGSLCQSDTTYQITVPPYYDIWGQVFAGSNNVHSGNVSLYSYSSNEILLLDEVSIDTLTGLYFFAQRIGYKYLLHGVPGANSTATQSFAPVYHDENIFWEDVSEILLDHDYSNFDIFLEEMSPLTSGSGLISGNTVDVALQPLGNSLIFLLDYYVNRPVLYTYSNAVGNYQFNSLPNGKYWLVGDRPGYSSTKVLIELTNQNNSYTNQQIIFNDVMTSTNDLYQQGKIVCYPVPAEEILYVRLPELLINSRVAYKITSITGTVLINRIEFGGETIKIDINSLSRGYYMLSVYGDGCMFPTKFLKI